jgi:hypothetical protein
MGHRSITISNNFAIFAWVFMAIAMSSLVLMTTSAVEQPNTFSSPTNLTSWLFMWACGLGMSAIFFSMPYTRLTIEDGWVVVREIWLWKITKERFEVGQCDRPEILRTKDSDGDPYFALQLLTPNGRNLTLAEGTCEAEVEATRNRLIAAMGTTPAAR